MNVVVDSTDIIKSQNAYSDKCGEVKSLSFQIAKKDLQIQSLTRQLAAAKKGLEEIELRCKRSDGLICDCSANVGRRNIAAIITETLAEMAKHE